MVSYFTIREEGGKPVQGKKNMVVLMEKNKKYLETGGWLFAGFTPEETIRDRSGEELP